MQPFIHRAGKGLWPSTVLACAITPYHDLNIGMSVATVGMWILTIFFGTMAGQHQWDLCSLCAHPPKIIATDEARNRIAHRHHGTTNRWLMRFMIFAFLVHVVSPKPYMDPPWAKPVMAVIYLGVAMVFLWDFRRSILHKRSHSECHVEWCRAGLSNDPAKFRRKQRHVTVGHYGLWFILVISPVVCILGFFSLRGVGDPFTTFGYPAALIVLILVILDVMVLHSDTPCTHCARNLPDNPEEAAEKRMKWLKTFHRARWWLIGGSLTVWVGSWIFPAMVAGRIMLYVGVLSVCLWAVLDRIHSPVKPWCPWCRDDGGEEAAADVPDPSTNIPSPV